VAQRQAAARAHLPLPARRQLDGEAGGNEPALARGDLQRAVDGGAQVAAGAAAGRTAWQRQVVAVRQAANASSRTGALELALPRDVLNGLTAPFEVRDLRLDDQGRMGVLHRQARGLVIE